MTDVSAPNNVNDSNEEKNGVNSQKTYPAFYDPENIAIPNLFSQEDIEEMKYSTTAMSFVYDKVNIYFRSTFNVEFDSNMLFATAEFNISNLQFLISKFTFPNEILAKLLNALMLLLHLREEPADIMNSTNESRNLYSMHGSQTNFNKLNHKEKEVDFSIIAKKKLFELRSALIKLNLIKKENFACYSNDNKSKKQAPPIVSLNDSNLNSYIQSNHGFYLQPNEVSILLNYINTFYFPFIRLYYHFLNIEKVTENKKIEIIISKPLNIPSLSEAVPQILERNQYDEIMHENESDEHTEDHEEYESEINKELMSQFKTKDLKDTHRFSMLNEGKGEERSEMSEVKTKQDIVYMLEDKVDHVIQEVDSLIYMKQKKIEDKIYDAEEQLKPKAKK